MAHRQPVPFRSRTQGLAVAALLFLLSLACSDSGTDPQPVPPATDFSLSISAAAFSVRPGTTSPSVTISVVGKNSFSGSVAVSVAGLPEGVVVSPAPSFSLDAGATQQVTVTAAPSVAPGEYPLKVVGISGNLSHDAALSLSVIPSIRTYEQGSLWYLERVEGQDTVRIALNPAWGGSIVEASLNGENFVNSYDDGREVQVALYDGIDQYDDCAGCKGIWGWNPVQGGDRHNQGSPVLEKTFGSTSIYIKALANEWVPDNKKL